MAKDGYLSDRYSHGPSLRSNTAGDRGVWKSHPRRRFLLLTGAAAAAAGSSRKLRAEPQDANASARTTSASATTFETVWETVRDRFNDPRQNGLDWPAIRARYEPDAVQATNDEALAAIVNRMLAELHASHTRYYTSDEPE